MCIKTYFFCTWATFSVPAAGLFSRSRLQGVQVGRLYTRCKLGPQRSSVARALGVQSRANWRVIAGSPSAEPEPRKTMENPHFIFVAPLSQTITTLASSFPRSYSDGHSYVCLYIAYGCVLYATCACVCIGVWEPHISAFCSYFALLAAAISCLYHTIPQVLELSTLWKPRYNCRRTSRSSFCDGHGRCICVRVRAMFPRGTNT